jgi:hypothetical protein
MPVRWFGGSLSCLRRTTWNPTNSVRPMPHKMIAAWIHLVASGQERLTIQRPVTSVSAYPG